MLDVVLCWGKSLKAFESTRSRATHHPAICHMLDVGLMAQALLEQAGVTVKRLLCDPLNCDDSQKILWLAFFVALHDLGKISPGFQYKRKDLIEEVLKKKLGYSIELFLTLHLHSIP
jgi:CRISPR-associated endonuclease/helicase Cas3